MSRLAICFSPGIRAIRHIERFIGVTRLISPNDSWSDSDDVCVLAWGRKKSTLRALNYATKHKLKVLHLEDGFLRTCSPDSHSRMTYSMIIDRKGVYYDATVSSDLELFLNSRDAEMDRAILEAGEELVQACMEIVIENNLTKYNYCPDYVPGKRADSVKTVLVVDQTKGDASVVYGGMDESGFATMLDTAIREHPGARILVKTHPDVVAGRSQGYLTSIAQDKGIDILGEYVNPISLLKTVDHVYVGTSQLGMEALLCGKPVSVFGRPFYAGWGLTDDRLTLPGRDATRSLLELFFAAYFWYPRYVNPITGQMCLLPDALQHMLLQKGIYNENARNFLCVGITPWKRRYIANYLRSPSGSVNFCAASQIDRQMIKKKCDVICTWSYKVEKLRNPADKGYADEIWRMEDGFLRSVGLGSDFSAPSSLVIDYCGLYFNATQMSGLEKLLNGHDCTLEEVLRASRLISLILSAKLSKYNLEPDQEFVAGCAPNKRRLLVVGQVENDASLEYGCHSIRTNTELLKVVRERNPDAWIVYKPHPDVVAGNRPGKISETDASKTINQLIEDASIVSCIENTDELHTMTSLSGFEALLRGKKVVTYGKPFYAGWGLTQDQQEISSRSRQRTLEELVHCALIAYPRYMDIDTGEFATPEDIVNRIKNNQMHHGDTHSWTQRQVLKLVNVYKGLSYAP